VATKLSVVVPVHNEGRTLGLLLSTLQQELGVHFPSQHEMIVVDDASTDETQAILAIHGTLIKAVRHESRKGSGAARRTGSALAIGEWVAWIDGDGTYSVHSLVALFGAMGDTDQIIGARSTDHGTLKWLRLAVKTGTAQIAGFLWRVPIPDLNSGLRIFRRDSLNVWLGEIPDGFSCTTTATLAALNHGQKVIFQPIDYLPREKIGESKFHPIWDTLRLWRTIWRQWRKRKPTGAATR
jgi:glycosyltransferase involved in cell wall biosynthesis